MIPTSYYKIRRYFQGDPLYLKAAYPPKTFVLWTKDPSEAYAFTNLEQAERIANALYNAEVYDALPEYMSAMFGHLVGEHQVWLIERTVAGVTHYLHDFDANGTAYWSKKIDRAVKFQRKDQGEAAWYAIGERGDLKQWKLADLMSESC